VLSRVEASLIPESPVSDSSLLKVVGRLEPTDPTAEVEVNSKPEKPNRSLTTRHIVAIRFRPAFDATTAL
jgi:hypothetical protein